MTENSGNSLVREVGWDSTISSLLQFTVVYDRGPVLIHTSSVIELPFLSIIYDRAQVLIHSL